MRKLLSFLLLPLLLLSCKDENPTISNELIGEWELVEIFMGTGIGSEGNAFVAVESDKFLVFDENGVVTGNGNFCNAPVINGSGTYSLLDSTITVNCNPTASLPFEIDSENLIVYYSCYEGCAEKYIKVNDAESL